MSLLDNPFADDEGIDRKQLTNIKQAFTFLNQTRYERTLAALSERQQQFLQILPLLFHVNHPMLPGYVSHNTPAGIHEYKPNKDDIRTAKLVARSVTVKDDLIDKTTCIEALFMMGSLGSVAHADNSDVDVWVCHTQGLSAQAMAELQEKCLRLTRWAAETIHLEAHFFLMNAAQFRAGQVIDLNSESSGSAQHYLLLDEFYRSAVWLAGKLPLWWFVPAEHEKNYGAYTQHLLTKRFLRANEHIDFGGLASIPTNEFIGAGIWQLYKGIDSPYKSILKLLLLEAYANDGFNDPLSLSAKRNIYQAIANNKPIDANAFDAYVLVYNRLQDYLLFNNQRVRLELMRRCFYFKTGKQLSRTNKHAKKTWQRLLLEQMVGDWGWDNRLLTILDNRAYWKSPHVLAERNLLANELNQSYRLLIDMNKNNLQNAAISSTELAILGRKLHAAFERKAGKIDWINPNISKDLSEPAVCFFQTQDDGTLMWQAYRGSQQDFYLRNQAAAPIKRSRHFIELLVWCYANGILTTTTKLDIDSKQCHLQPHQRHQLLHTLAQWLPLPIEQAPHEAFTQNTLPQAILLLLNVGVEPQADLQRKGMQMLSNQHDAFGYSGLKENLVISADIVQKNSWGEIVCRHFNQDALINLLLHYLRSIPPGKQQAPPALSIRCFSLGQGNIIEQRVLALWRAVITCFYSGTHTRHTRFLFEMADEYFLLQWVQQQPQIQRFKDYPTLLEKLSTPQLEFSPLVIDDFALRNRPLRLYAEAVKSPATYIFYRIEKTAAQLTVVDSHGNYFFKQTTFLNVPILLRPLCRFIRSAIERQLLENNNHPQLNTTTHAAFNLHIYELMGEFKQKNIRLEPRQAGTELGQLGFINVCAIAEPNTDNTLLFTLFCDGKEFSALEYGDELFVAVAKYIIAHRTLGETYPCYITDLDLSLCKELIAPQTGLQLIHYLQVKNEIELSLNGALKRL